MFMYNIIFSTLFQMWSTWVNTSKLSNVIIKKTFSSLGKWFKIFCTANDGVQLEQKNTLQIPVQINAYPNIRWFSSSIPLFTLHLDGSMQKNAIFLWNHNDHVCVYLMKKLYSYVFGVRITFSSLNFFFIRHVNTTTVIRIYFREKKIQAKKRTSINPN